MRVLLNQNFIRIHENADAVESINPLSHTLMPMEISSCFGRTLTSKWIMFFKSRMCSVSIRSLF
jgi:hypothetical protein